jgi:murein DD-endopeptidase MepM/ murein hydrolase activator NlpD
MKYYSKNIVFVLLFLFIASVQIAGAQGLNELKKKQQQLEKEILGSTKLLQKTEKRRKNTVNQIYILNRQIQNRKKLIKGYQREIQLIGKKISGNREKIDSINRRIETLKKEYAWIVIKYYEVYKQKGGVMAYIFASESLNQAYRRMKYYQQFMNYGKDLYKDLEKARDVLNREVEKLEKNRKDRERAVAQLKNEQRKLLGEKRKKNLYVQNLQKQEKEIRKDIQRKRKIKRRLSDEMKRILAEEKKKGKGALTLTPEEKVIAGNFSKNKGKLPWPTARGVIIDDFGEHRHPVLKNVTIKNDGVDIMSEKGGKARAVFEGEVRKIIAIPGANETVIIKHGNFYTVYQNVYKVSVKKGQHVSIKEPLGTIFTDPKTGETILHFEIWSGMTKMDPEIWLAKRK